MTDDTTQVELLLHETLAAQATSGPPEFGAWHRFEARRARRTRLVRTGAALAFAAIVATAVLVPRWVGGRGAAGPVAPASTPATSVPLVGADVDPAGQPLIVASGTVAGRSWAFELYHSVGGQLCARWGEGGSGSCGVGDHASWGASPWDGEGNTTGLGTSVGGTVGARVTRVRIELRGRPAVEVATRGAKEFGVAAYATVLPGHAIVTRITAYDARGTVVFDDRHPYNSAWP